MATCVLTHKIQVGTGPPLNKRFVAIRRGQRLLATACPSTVRPQGDPHLSPACLQVAHDRALHGVPACGQATGPCHLDADLATSKPARGMCATLLAHRHRPPHMSGPPKQLAIEGTRTSPKQAPQAPCLRCGQQPALTSPCSIPMPQKQTLPALCPWYSRTHASWAPPPARGHGTRIASPRPPPRCA